MVAEILVRPSRLVQRLLELGVAVRGLRDPWAYRRRTPAGSGVGEQRDEPQALSRSGTGSSSPARARSRSSASRTVLFPAVVKTVWRDTPERSAICSMAGEGEYALDEKLLPRRQHRRPGRASPRPGASGSGTPACF